MDAEGELIEKRYIFCILICFAVFNTCVEPLQLNAQSGSSICRVTAAAGEEKSPSAGNNEDWKENAEEPETTEKPDAGAAGEPEVRTSGKPEKEETVPDQIREAVPEELPEENDGYGGLIRWLLWGVIIICISAALSAGGAFRWLLFLLSGRRGIRFHGILTGKRNFFIRVKNKERNSRLVQDMINNAGSLAELKKELIKETAATCIPGQSRMRISWTGRNGRKRVREVQAGERSMFQILEKLEGAGEVEVRITCRGTGIDIPLAFRV